MPMPARILFAEPLNSESLKQNASSAIEASAATISEAVSRDMPLIVLTTVAAP